MVKSLLTAPSPSSSINCSAPSKEKFTVGRSFNSLEFTAILPDICNGPIIAIKIAKNRALRQDVAADMDKRSNVRTSNIPLQPCERVN